MLKHLKHLDSILDCPLIHLEPPAVLIPALRQQLMDDKTLSNILSHGFDHPDFVTAFELFKAEVVVKARAGNIEGSICGLQTMQEPTQALALGIDLLQIALRNRDSKSAQSIVDAVSLPVTASSLCEHVSENLSDEQMFNDGEVLIGGLSVDPDLLYKFLQLIHKSKLDASTLNKWIEKELPITLNRIETLHEYLDSCVLSQGGGSLVPDDDVLEAVTALSEDLTFCCAASFVGSAVAKNRAKLEKCILSSVDFFDENTEITNQACSIIIKPLSKMLCSVLPKIPNRGEIAGQIFNTINPAVSQLLFDRNSRAEGVELTGLYIASLLRAQSCLDNDIILNELDEISQSYRASLNIERSGTKSSRAIRTYAYSTSVLSAVVEELTPREYKQHARYLHEKLLFNNRIETTLYSDEKPIENSDFSHGVRGTTASISILLREGKLTEARSLLSQLTRYAMQFVRETKNNNELEAASVGAFSYCLTTAQRFSSYGHTEEAKRILIMIYQFIHNRSDEHKKSTDLVLENIRSVEKDYVEIAAQAGCVSHALEAVRRIMKQEAEDKVPVDFKSTNELTRRLIIGLSKAPIAPTQNFNDL